MNRYCQNVFHQIEIAVQTIENMIELLSEEDLPLKTSPYKRSIGEMLEHLALICGADAMIADGAAEETMDSWYRSHSLNGLKEIRQAQRYHFSRLKDTYSSYTEEQLHERKEAFWGAAYSRFEWLLEIQAHIYHHRGQLHAMLVHLEKDPKVLLFE